MKKFTLLFFSSLFLSCTSNTNEAEAPPLPSKINLIANVDNLRVREEAGIESPEVARLSEGTPLQFIGEISDFTTELELRGVKYNDPWLKVRTTKGIEGWVYAAAVKFNLKGDGKALYERIVTKRLGKFFGEDLVHDIESYQKRYETARTQEEFAEVYRFCRQMLPKLNKKLEESMSLFNLAELPDLFWIDQSLPAIEMELVAEGTIYQLFIDFKQLQEQTSTTKGKADDDFIALQLKVYPDGVEYYYAAWFLQTWDYGGYSLLGQGIHKQILDEMQRVWASNDLFSFELKQLKEEILADITDAEGYGETPEKIIAEIDAIAKAGYNFLSADDLTLLQNRRAMFANPQQHGISVNQRDGF